MRDKFLAERRSLGLDQAAIAEESALIHEAKIELGHGVILLSSQAKPLYRFGVVLRHVLAVPINQANVGLGDGITLVGKW